MTMVVGHSPNNLDAAITKAKEIETGFVIAQPIQQQQIMANQMELLQQQVSELTANLANTQVQQTNRYNNWNNQNRNQRNYRSNEQRKFECWNCGEEGHMARDCQSETKTKAQPRNQTQSRPNFQLNNNHSNNGPPQRNVNLAETEEAETEQETYMTTRSILPRTTQTISPRSESNREQKNKTPLNLQN